VQKVNRSAVKSEYRAVLGAEGMPTFSHQILSSLPRVTFVDILDILIVAFLIYQFLMAVRGRRAAHILTGVLILLVIYGSVTVLRLELVRTTLGLALPYMPFALVVLFQSEIRRFLSRIGGRQWMTLGSRLQRREFIEELISTVTQLQQEGVGAIIVVERDIGLRTFIESGVAMDAWLSRDLLLTIFFPGSPLHDGAVIVQGGKIAAAACFLPLSVKPAIARRYGTRHRAAIGVTEETDCLSLIVSEETAHISVASFGELEANVSPERLKQRLTEHLITRRAVAPHPPEQTVREDAHIRREETHDAAVD
jgi:diadenylate cyclase